MGKGDIGKKIGQEGNTDAILETPWELQGRLGDKREVGRVKGHLHSEWGAKSAADLQLVKVLE